MLISVHKKCKKIKANLTCAALLPAVCVLLSEYLTDVLGAQKEKQQRHQHTVLCIEAELLPQLQPGAEIRGAGSPALQSPAWHGGAALQTADERSCDTQTLEPVHSAVPEESKQKHQLPL